MDRNLCLSSFALVSLWSLSARRAWIEIALLNAQNRHLASLSARRAWIEIALLNAQNRHLASRSPQGERG